MEIFLSYLPRIFLGLIALAFLGFGVLGWINPVGTVAPLDITIQAAQAKTEIRATYGGFMVGVGLLLLFTAVDTNAVRFGLVSVAVVLFSIGLTRLYGIVVDNTQASLQWQLLAMELIPAALAVLLLVFHPINKT
jgi:hypothetical protein